MFERSLGSAQLKRGPKKRERIPDQESDDDDTDTLADDASQIDVESEKGASTSQEKEKKDKRDPSHTFKESHSKKIFPDGKEKRESQSATAAAAAAAVRKTNAILEALVDSESSSSEDQPLSKHKELVGTKRKAEVLSKESGKIGVTIKTSSPDGPPSAKLHCGESAAPISAPLKSEPAPLSPETPASHPESNTPPEKPSTDRVNNENAAQNDLREGNNQNDDIEVAGVDQKNDDAMAANENNNGSKALAASPRSVPPRLWLPKARSTDQVFITDVTVNLETVTIRECKTERGFFRERTAT